MAAARACLVVALLLLVALFSPSEATSSTSLRRRQVRSLLKRLNKPPLATFQSLDGDIIDCVHISNQPAFDHPLLKDHTIQMRPSIQPSGLYGEATRPFTQTWNQNGEKCPDNTIPIRRTKEEDVMRATSVTTFGKKTHGGSPHPHSHLGGVTDGHHYGVAYATGDANYYGTKVTINVYPAMYGDDKTRLFIYWTRDAYNTTGCYNLACSGFIQTNPQFVIGGSLSPVSIYGSTQYEYDYLVWKDPAGGNWWLQLQGNYVGYWPSSIFTLLQTGVADTVEWGGEVYSPQITAPMGSGHFPEEGFGKATYSRAIQVVDSSNHLKPPNGVGLIAPLPNCYNIMTGSSSTTSWGTYIYYGGPGCPQNSQIEVIRAKKLQQEVNAFLSRFTYEATPLGQMEDMEGYTKNTKTIVQDEESYTRKTRGYTLRASNSSARCKQRSLIIKRKPQIYMIPMAAARTWRRGGACLVVVALLILLVAIVSPSEATSSTSLGRRQVRSLLKRLNKPPLATFQSPDEDTIDCVHISRQPAFDHPLLKNHTIQNGEKCPDNTIPIRRTKEEDVMRATSVTTFGKKTHNGSPHSHLAGVTDGHHYGVAYATGDAKYYGTKVTINVGNWWLQVQGKYVGYWPSSIFTHLRTGVADTVEWGGEVYSPRITTPMGSGHFPEEGFGKATYSRAIQVVDSSNHLKPPKGVGLIAPLPNCYNVIAGSSSTTSWDTYIYYGGPGCPRNSQIEVM
uniref:Neprosin PEP catalytic domain-containing protein n=1 Tax=Oryza nivara TaxID=4536 RepID=A0A0E0FN24_ORYNI